MKNRVLLGLFVFTAAVVLLCGAGATNSLAKDKIVIGQAISLSGPVAQGVAIAGGRDLRRCGSKRSIKVAGYM